jgi:hypothetical protein
MGIPGFGVLQGLEIAVVAIYFADLSPGRRSMRRETKTGSEGIKSGHFDIEVSRP